MNALPVTGKGAGRGELIPAAITLAQRTGRLLGPGDTEGALLPPPRPRPPSESGDSVAVSSLYSCMLKEPTLHGVGES